MSLYSASFVTSFYVLPLANILLSHAQHQLKAATLQKFHRAREEGLVGNEIARGDITREEDDARGSNLMIYVREGINVVKK